MNVKEILLLIFLNDYKIKILSTFPTGSCLSTEVIVISLFNAFTFLGGCLVIGHYLYRACRAQAPLLQHECNVSAVPHRAK